MDLIERSEAIEAVNKALDKETILQSFVRKIAVDAIKGMPSAQPEPSIPISWIKKKIDWLASLDNAFSSLTANILSVMVKQYEEGYDFDADTKG